ncbi:MAG: SCP2 sterol-binding domain-containing protein [Acidimicrobiaceae bacterium]|nr:SCP2 sterol-binding domain-containing protein [Acidimicrobiaceae bacterium]
MAKYAFLSDEWVAAARALRAEYAERAHSLPVAVRVNQIVRNAPFGEGTINAHVDTTSGLLDIDLGHLEDPDVTITLDYDVARALLVERDPAAAMQAFMSGRIKVDGDIAKLLALQAPGALGPVSDPAAAAVAAEMGQRLLDMTE